jgi:muramoyltetrapeptide carboxypeptidase
MYNIDRLLFHMGHATQLKGIAGVRLGDATAIKPNEPEWAESLEYMVQRWCRDLGVPYLGRADIGHTQSNRVVPFGMI